MLLRSQCEEDADLPALISEKELCHIQHEYDAADGRDAKAHPDLFFGVTALGESSLDQRAAYEHQEGGDQHDCKCSAELELLVISFVSFS